MCSFPAQVVGQQSLSLAVFSRDWMCGGVCVCVNNKHEQQSQTLVAHFSNRNPLCVCVFVTLHGRIKGAARSVLSVQDGTSKDIACPYLKMFVWRKRQQHDTNISRTETHSVCVCVCRVSTQWHIVHTHICTVSLGITCKPDLLESMCPPRGVSCPSTHHIHRQHVHT